MNYFVLLLIFALTIPAQKIQVYTVKDDQPTFLIEKEIIKKSVKLYNFNNKNSKISYSVKFLPNFQTLFDNIDNVNEKTKDQVCAIYQITITQKRLKSYDFSTPYLPVKESIMCLSSRTDINYLKKGIKIGYLASSIQEKQYNLIKKYGIIGVSYNSNELKNNGLLKNETDFVFIDNVEAWGRKDVKVAADLDLQHGNGFGILFPKNSELRNKLDPYIKEFLTSKSFYNLLFKTFGKNVAVQYKKGLDARKN
jgi:glutamine transport system substrate-binding protein